METTAIPDAPTENKRLLEWVEEVASLTEPQAIHWCDGSAEEYDRLCALLVQAALSASSPTLSVRAPISRSLTPATWHVWRTGLSSAPRPRRKRAPPTTGATRTRCAKRSPSCSRVRCRAARCTWSPSRWDPWAPTRANIGVQLTDSAYVAVSMRIMTRMGAGALEELGEESWCPCPACTRVGMPARASRTCRAVQRGEQVHRPFLRRARSGPTAPVRGNAPLGKKCFALRIASVMARDEGWMAEHMLIQLDPRPRARASTTGAFPAPAARRTRRC